MILKTKAFLFLNRSISSTTSAAPAISTILVTSTPPSLSSSSSSASSSTTASTLSPTALSGIAPIECPSANGSTYVPGPGYTFQKVCAVDWPIGEDTATGKGKVDDLEVQVSLNPFPAPLSSIHPFTQGQTPWESKKRICVSSFFPQVESHDWAKWADIDAIAII